MHSASFLAPLALSFGLGLLPASPSWVLSLPPQESSPLASELDTLRDLLRQQYVFPDVAEEIIHLLTEKEAAGEYDQLARAEDLTRVLTQDLQSINRDEHLAVRVKPVAAERSELGYSHAFLRARGAAANFGFAEARRLDGNVGYLRMSSFSLDEMYVESTAAASAAMAFLCRSDALVIDLRDNPGGGARLVRFLCSYFFEEEPVLLNTYYFRDRDAYLEYWTLEDLPGVRLPEVPLYLLVDGQSFSSAEAFAYILKHLGRAQVVGQSTWGGSHGGRTHSLSDRLEVFIPFSRSIHPVTGTDFEGEGVQPDVVCPSETALDVAHLAALRELSGHPSEDPAAAQDWRAAESSLLQRDPDLSQYLR